MMTAPHDIGDGDPPDAGAPAHARGSFFGRRKGHKLRIHQADLIDNLLPHLAIDISTPAPDRLTELFDGEIWSRGVRSKPRRVPGGPCSCSAAKKHSAGSAPRASSGVSSSCLGSIASRYSSSLTFASWATDP